MQLQSLKNAIGRKRITGLIRRVAMKSRIRILITCLVLLLGFGQTGVAAQAKVSLNKKKAQITVGSSLSLNVKGTKKKVKWSTSNKKIATVKSTGKVKCKVTAKKAGKATVTAKAGNKKYKCKVTVVKKSGSMADNSDQGTDNNKTPEKSDDTATPSEETTKIDAGEYSLDKVHTGEGTFYDLVSGGAANLDDMGSQYYTAAMNNEDYLNGLAGAYIEITDKDGDKINVLITDRLPEGKKGDIDLTRKAFNVIEPEVTGRMNITWKIIPFPTDEPIQYVFKPTSTQYWAEIQVRNHRYPIAKLEYLDAVTNTYVVLPRQEYNYFTAASGMGGPGPYTFRVTDIYGHQLVDTGIAINKSAPVNGAANFPY